MFGQGIGNAHIRPFNQANELHFLGSAHPLIPLSVTSRNFFYTSAFPGWHQQVSI